MNLEAKTIPNYAPYYSPWTPAGHLHLPAMGGQGSFTQMLGSVEPPRVCVQVSAPLNRQDVPTSLNRQDVTTSLNRQDVTTSLNRQDVTTLNRQDISSLNRQDIIPVLANASQASSAVNMTVGHGTRDGSVGMTVSHRQDESTGSLVVSQMPNTIHKEYWPATVSGMHTTNIGNSSLVSSAGHTSDGVIGSTTSCSYMKIDNSKFQSIRVNAPMYQTGLQEGMVPVSCGKVVREAPYSMPTVSSLCTISQSYPDVTTSAVSVNEPVQHQMYHKLVNSSDVRNSQTIDTSRHEDIVAKALNATLDPDNDVPGQYCTRESILEMMKAPTSNANDFRQNVSEYHLDSDLRVHFNKASSGSAMKGDFVSNGEKPTRRGPGRPPLSAGSGDDDQSKPYECDYCERRFKHTQQRRVHVMSHTGERPHVCPYCQKGFKTLAQKTDHIRVHTGDKPYKCTICWKEFGKYATMKKHLNTHLDTPPYSCPHCEKAFYLADKLKVHIREHTNERPFKCDECERAFRNTNHLKFHKMVHSGEVPFRCEICWKGFQDKVKFDRHQICHQNDNLLRCANCQQGFARVEQMTEHLDTCRAREDSTKSPSGWVSF